MMDARTVLRVLDRLASRGLWAGVAGGWGVDALVGRQTRDHSDLDLSIRFENGAAVLACLAAMGFTVDTDWRPVRVAVRDIEGRQVDVHPLRFTAAGAAVQAGLDGTSYHYPPGAWTCGSIGGRSVECLTVDLQRRFHSGYRLQDKDRHDLEVLDSVAAPTAAVPA